jgi:hypothetical protein
MKHPLPRALIALVPLTALVLGGTNAPVAAQALYAGVRSGASFATFGGRDSDGLDSYRSGMTVGIQAGYGLSALVHLQTELAWVQKGAEGTLQGFEEPVQVSLSTDYLQLPLLVRLRLPTPIRVQPILLAGPAVSLELDCDVETSMSELALTLGCEDSAPEGQRRKVDWSLIMGGGLAVDMARVTLVLEGRYDLGLRTLNDVSDVEVKNRGFTITAGLTFTP